MHPDFKLRRRVLTKTYENYLAADRAWIEASREVQTWMPRLSRRSTFAIGNPGSRLRAIYDRRDRALRLLTVARLKLENAKQRVLLRKSASLIGCLGQALFPLYNRVIVAHPGHASLRSLN